MAAHSACSKYLEGAAHGGALSLHCTRALLERVRVLQQLLGERLDTWPASGYRGADTLLHVLLRHLHPPVHRSIELHEVVVPELS